MQDWKFLSKQKGFKSATPEIAIDILQLPFRHLKFYVLELPLSNRLPEQTPRITLTIRPFENSDLQLVKKMNRPSEVKQCERRLMNDDKGLVAVYKDEVVGYAWGSTTIRSNVEKIPIRLKPGDFLCTDVFTAPKYRGKGIQTSLSLARFRLFQDLGYKNAVCYIEVHNKPSLAVWQKKLGAKTTGKIDFLRVLIWYKIQCSDNMSPIE